jgi:hypothetical protein
MPHTNRLANEKSPYLLQHAHNPVDWYPWGPEAFDKARREDKPIFLSVGYSTCHWCHVMERESFEDESIAALLNESFVAVKVDREERPDVDRVYMTFVQATSGGGGWPLSVWMTPDLRPFFGGTYFPPEPRQGRPGFASILSQIAAAWESDRDQIVESAGDVVEQLRQHLDGQAGGAPRPGLFGIDRRLLDSGFYAFRRGFDVRLGGFGGAPKFPRPSVLNFLLRYHAATRNQEALDMVLLTLREMAKGGIDDQLGGGFHRYSVDDHWLVPHFEKMLYDQAQLATSCLEAFQITGEAEYAAVARRTLDYAMRDMRHAGGGFYSAEDADSAADTAYAEEKSEGAFYLWRAEEIRRVAGPAAEWFCYRYGVEERGNATAEFEGRNILCQAHSVEETAGRFGRPAEEMRAALAQAEGALLEARARRPRPHLDDKILAAWNGLMISALALGGAVLDEPRYAEAARAAAGFLFSHMYDAPNGTLLRRYREGEAAIPGFLEDYALTVQGLLDLYEAQFEVEWLEMAARLTRKQMELFEDREGGGFFSAVGGPDLVLQVKEDYDGAEPSGNSVAAMNLLRLARMTGRSEFREAAERTLSGFSAKLDAAPSALPQMLAACEFLLGGPREVVLVGARGGADTAALVRELHSRFAPNRVALLVDSPETRRKLAEGIPAIESMGMVQDRATAYVCRDYACQAPVCEAEKLGELLE